jgi:hypothetical protein
LPFSIGGKVMNNETKKAYHQLTTIGDFYEIEVLEDIDHRGHLQTTVIQGELRGWNCNEERGLIHAMIWPLGHSCAEEVYSGDILSVRPMDKPVLIQEMFFEPYKGRTVSIGMKVDIYRNLHTNNGYSIRCSKSGLVLSHCSTVRIKNAKFHVSESGRLKTVEQKRKRVHAYVRGELVAYNEEIPKTFVKVLYNPYHTSLFMNSKTNEPLYEADEVMCSGKFAYAAISERLL